MLLALPEFTAAMVRELNWNVNGQAIQNSYLSQNKPQVPCINYRKVDLHWTLRSWFELEAVHLKDLAWKSQYNVQNPREMSSFCINYIVSERFWASCYSSLSKPLRRPRLIILKLSKILQRKQSAGQRAASLCKSRALGLPSVLKF